MRKIPLFIACLLAGAAPAMAKDSVSDFYKDKVVRIVVGIAAGSGYDINARLLARYLSSHIPGKPTIVVQNEPGAGSLTMVNDLYRNGPRDGTVIGAPFQGVPTTPLFEPEKAHFDPTKLNWIGSTNKEADVTYVWNSSPVQSLNDLKTKELLVGAQAPGSSQVDFPAVAKVILGLKFKIITGYEGTPQIDQAMERGEVQGNGATAWSTVKALLSAMLEQKKVKVIAQWGPQDNPELPGVPNIFSLAKTDADRQALMLVLGRLEYGRPFFVPPGVPEDRVAALRTAFDAAMKDPELLKDAAKARLDIDPLSGAEVATLVGQVAKTPPSVVARVKAALNAR